MAEEKLVAFYDFEKSNNLISTESFETTSGNVLEPNSFSSLGDGWGIYNRNTGGPFAIFDDSVQGSIDFCRKIELLPFSCRVCWVLFFQFVSVQ